MQKKSNTTEKTKGKANEQKELNQLPFIINIRVENERIVFMPQIPSNLTNDQIRWVIQNNPTNPQEIPSLFIINFSYIESKSLKNISFQSLKNNDNNISIETNIQSFLTQGMIYNAQIFLYYHRQDNNHKIIKDDVDIIIKRPKSDV
ncbi:MAG: hypothetical protein N2319_00050 [Candidatus Kapabacteria bacterium]|nr:hypothetical protein [Candidatus Kapabacteria bacterium]